MKDAYPHGAREGHDRIGEGNDLVCMRTRGLACESCTCQVPCADTYPSLVAVEVYRAPNRRPLLHKDLEWCPKGHQKWKNHPCKLC